MGDRQDLGKKQTMGGQPNGTAGTDGAVRPDVKGKAAKRKAGDGENEKAEKYFRFDNKVFRADEHAYFSIPEESQDPVLVMNYGGMDAHLSLPGIKKEFDLDPEGHDAKMPRCWISWPRRCITSRYCRSAPRAKS